MSLAGHDDHYLHLAWTVVSVFGIVIAVLLALLFRRARSRAETEEIERILAEDGRNPDRGHVSKRHGS
jgi:membrane protein implicated in regulation of membrane protease activity